MHSLLPPIIPQKNKTRLPAAMFVTAATLIVFPASSSESLSPTKADYLEVSTPATLELRGKALRKAIDDAYNKLQQERAIKNDGAGINDISSVVSPYIPVGTSFDAAEKILNSAGFRVNPRARNPRLSIDDPARSDLFATIDQYAITLSSKTSINVSLRPRKEGDYSIVTRIIATIRQIHL